jgi:hypothetical protein
MFTTDGRPTNPNLWVEDLYHNESQKFVGDRGLNEEVTAT